ncbi:hypothetical protein FHG87_020927 [Trinorchestia longiramus]|nr:hypothetical protein FHG87_020927 [Trinorchestia longiramus]
MHERLYSLHQRDALEGIDPPSEWCSGRYCPSFREKRNGRTTTAGKKVFELCTVSEKGIEKHEDVYVLLQASWVVDVEFWHSWNATLSTFCATQAKINILVKTQQLSDKVVTAVVLNCTVLYLINGLEVTDKIGDHQMIDFSLEVQDPNTRTQHKQVLDYKRANFELMKEELGSYNYEVLMNNKNAEECYMILKDKTATATDHYIPRKRIRPTNNPPWFSQEIKRLINARQHSY